MERKYSSTDEAVAVAKEALWLAWNAAGGPSGYGFFRDKPSATKEDVWQNAITSGDYSGVRASAERIDADYVFGRMLKLRFRVNGSALDVPDYQPRGDYQGWCHQYSSFAALFDAAEAQALKKAA